jgi:TonB family protein
MINYLLTSTFIHAAILLGLCYTPGCIKSEATEVNTSGAVKTEVTFIQKAESAPILHTLGKPLIRGQNVGLAQKVQKVDMSDYANQLKATVDPIWIGKIGPYQSKLSQTYEIIVLLLIDKYGRVSNMKIKKSSGVPKLDELALSVFRDIGAIPNPPESVVKEGVEWCLVF